MKWILLSLLTCALLSTSCTRIEGICYCRYYTGEEEAVDLSDYKPREARQRCSELNRTLSQTGGECRLD